MNAAGTTTTVAPSQSEDADRARGIGGRSRWRARAPAPADLRTAGERRDAQPVTRGDHVASSRHCRALEIHVEEVDLPVDGPTSEPGGPTRQLVLHTRPSADRRRARGRCRRPGGSRRRRAASRRPRSTVGPSSVLGVAAEMRRAFRRPRSTRAGHDQVRARSSAGRLDQARSAGRRRLRPAVVACTAVACWVPRTAPRPQGRPAIGDR